jgi:hypothetical protein
VNNFLDVVLPPLLLLGLAAVLSAAAVWWAAGKLRLYAAKRRRIDGARTALSQARDGLAAAISDPGLGDANRNQVMTAYDAVTRALTKEKNPT